MAGLGGLRAWLGVSMAELGWPRTSLRGSRAWL
jgi:hypothetical protein